MFLFGTCCETVIAENKFFGKQKPGAKTCSGEISI
jgi:hypothetical protein